MRARAALATLLGGVLAVAVVASVDACTTFGGEDVSGSEAGAEGSPTSDGASGDEGGGATTEAGADGPTPSPGITCGALQCPAGFKCCMGNGNPTCQSVACGADQWTMECTAPDDCASPKPACCWNADVPLTFCAATCAGAAASLYTVCNAQEDCDGSVCAPAKCNGRVSLQVCRKSGTKFVDYSGATPECQPP